MASREAVERQLLGNWSRQNRKGQADQGQGERQGSIQGQEQGDGEAGEGFPKLRQHGGGGWRAVYVYFCCVVFAGWGCMAGGFQVVDSLQSVLDSPAGDLDGIGTDWHLGDSQRQQTRALSATKATEPQKENGTEDRAFAECPKEEAATNAGLSRSYQGHAQEGAREVCCRKERNPRTVGCSTRATGPTGKGRDGSRGDGGTFHRHVGGAGRIVGHDPQARQCTFRGRVPEAPEREAVSIIYGDAVAGADQLYHGQWWNKYTPWESNGGCQTLAKEKFPADHHAAGWAFQKIQDERRPQGWESTRMRRPYWSGFLIHSQPRGEGSDPENSTSGSGSPETPTIYCRKFQVSQHPVFVAILADHEAGNPQSTVLLDDFTKEIARENRYISTSGSLESSSGCGAPVTILKNDDRHAIDFRSSSCQLNARRERSEEGCTSLRTFRISNRTINSLGHTDAQNEKSAEGCTSFCFAEVWRQGSNNYGRNERSAEGCTSLRPLQDYKWWRRKAKNKVSDATENGLDEHQLLMMNTLRIFLIVQTVGYHYFVCLQLLCYVIVKLCFLHFGTDYADVGSELCWQILRGGTWALTAFWYLAVTQRTKPKRLQVVQHRRHSVGVRVTRGYSYKGLIWVCLILNTHAIAAAQGPAWKDYETHSRTASQREQTTISTEYEDRHGDLTTVDLNASADGGATMIIDLPREGRRHARGYDCDHQQRLTVYGHHSQLGAYGPRSTLTRISSYEDVERAACEVWQDQTSVTTCYAQRSNPQPTGYLTMIALLDYDEPYEPVVLIDIDLRGGVPRRYTLQLDQHEQTGQIIQRVDRDRHCYPHGVADCVLRHAASVFFDFETYNPQPFDYVSVFEMDFAAFEQEEDLLSLWQSTVITTKGVLAPIFPSFTTRLDEDDDPDICVLDEYIYPYPYPRDENELLDMPPRPLWLSQLNDLALLQTMQAQHPGRVTLDTYGLHDEYVGNRVAQIVQMELANMIRTVSQLWAEYAIGSHMYIFRADPQPEGTPPNTMVLVVEFPLRDRDHTYWRATLLDKKIDGRATDRIAAYIPHAASVAHVAEAADHENSCWPQGLEECHIIAKSVQYSHQDRVRTSSGDYIIFMVYSFQSRFGLLRNIFPDAHQYARDFLWRSRHYGRQEFTILVLAVTGHYQRTAPRPLRRTIDDFRHAEELCKMQSMHGPHTAPTTTASCRLYGHRTFINLVKRTYILFSRLDLFFHGCQFCSQSLPISDMTHREELKHRPGRYPDNPRCNI